MIFLFVYVQKHAHNEYELIKVFKVLTSFISSLDPPPPLSSSDPFSSFPFSSLLSSSFSSSSDEDDEHDDESLYGTDYIIALNIWLVCISFIGFVFKMINLKEKKNPAYLEEAQPVLSDVKISVVQRLVLVLCTLSIEYLAEIKTPFLMFQSKCF